MQFNAVFKKVPEGYIGFVEELPGANTLEEARAPSRGNSTDAQGKPDAC